MRHHRTAKFAEYLSTYAILHHIGLHPTVLLEKKDPSTGFGMFVRDACDAGTTLLVIPSKRCASNSVLHIIGTPISFPFSTPHSSSASSSSSTLDTLEQGLLSTILNSSSREWIEWCWRISLESHRNTSPLWGWLRSLPSAAELRDQTDSLSRHCHLHYSPSMASHYKKGWHRVQEELAQAYSLLEPVTLTAPPSTFFWAGLILLSRGLRMPRSWLRQRRRRPRRSTSSSCNPASLPTPTTVSLSDGSATAFDVSSSSSNAVASPLEMEARELEREEEEEELGVVPFIDLINGPDERGRRPNARIEIAFGTHELPDWYLSDLREEGGRKGENRNAIRDVDHFFSRLFDYHFCACVTLEKPLHPAEEVILDYSAFSSGLISTGGALTEEEDVLLTRFLKFLY